MAGVSAGGKAPGLMAASAGTPGKGGTLAGAAPTAASATMPGATAPPATMSGKGGGTVAPSASSAAPALNYGKAGKGGGVDPAAASAPDAGKASKGGITAPSYASDAGKAGKGGAIAPAYASDAGKAGKGGTSAPANALDAGKTGKGGAIAPASVSDAGKAGVYGKGQAPNTGVIEAVPMPEAPPVYTEVLGQRYTVVDQEELMQEKINQLVEEQLEGCHEQRNNTRQSLEPFNSFGESLAGQIGSLLTEVGFGCLNSTYKCACENQGRDPLEMRQPALFRSNSEELIGGEPGKGLSNLLNLTSRTKHCSA